MSAGEVRRSPGTSSISKLLASSIFFQVETVLTLRALRGIWIWGVLLAVRNQFNVFAVRPQLEAVETRLTLQASVWDIASGSIVYQAVLNGLALFALRRRLQIIPVLTRLTTAWRRVLNAVGYIARKTLSFFFVES